MKKLNIIAVDDDITIQDYLEDILSMLGHSFKIVATAFEVEELLKEEHFDCAILDMEIPSHYGKPSRIENGKLLLEKIRKNFNRYELPIIVITGHDLKSTELCSSIFRMGANDYVKKPFFPTATYTVEMALKNYSDISKANSMTTSNGWIFRENIGKTVKWQVKVNENIISQINISRSSMTNKILEVIFLQQDTEIISHAEFIDACGWDEFSYFKETKKGCFSAKRGAIKNHVSKIQNELSIGMEIMDNGIKISKPRVTRYETL